ncbi:unnamed protein product [Acanthoscelides obtectus]|uniref:Ig-like domain-containing protein n=1 Tax=Acanthoscelides obtectus TaxID=200917 RepID=A0A9P0PTE5_ACAOB|nr:unnamed protein product [Acanthoscelides obtectus]CAK1675238.1 Roundabout homolog 2 [Acanthoscelides obtectus]
MNIDTGYHYHNPSSSSSHHQNHHHQPPRITEHPVDTVVAKHDPATLKCEAAGQPPPTITWYKEGSPVKANQHRVLLPNGGLFFLRVAHGRKENDSGEYWCEASNALGKARSRNATLTVAVIALIQVNILSYGS